MKELKFYQEVKFYLIACLDIVILQIHNLEWVDENVKRASMIIGLLVGVLTAIKFTLDIISKLHDDYMKKQIKKLELKKKQEEIRRFFEHKHNRRHE
jgi:hypothetical protein